MPAAFTAAHTQPDNTDNLHDGYLNTLPEPSDPQEEVEVAVESNALRTIHLTVDGQDKIEAILTQDAKLSQCQRKYAMRSQLPTTQASDLVWSRPMEESIKRSGL